MDMLNCDQEVKICSYSYGTMHVITYSYIVQISKLGIHLNVDNVTKLPEELSVIQQN